MDKDLLAKIQDLLSQPDNPQLLDQLQARIASPDFAATLTALGVPDPAKAVSVLNFLLTVEKAVLPLLLKVLGLVAAFK